MNAQRKIPPAELDAYLAKGYFRMTDQLFTTDYIPYEDKLYKVHWLRFVLDKVHYTKEARRLLRVSKKFTEEIGPYGTDDETLELYDKFRKSRRLYTDTPLKENFGGLSGINPLDTKILKVRDGDRLIACGYFDQGENSIAGILNIYDPEYEKYSPGKMLMLLKIEYARWHGFQYYYPGYIISGLDRFDYKLFPCKASAEIYDSEEGEWVRFVKKPEDAPLLITEDLIAALSGRIND